MNENVNNIKRIDESFLPNYNKQHTLAFSERIVQNYQAIIQYLNEQITPIRFSIKFKNFQFGNLIHSLHEIFEPKNFIC